MQYQDFPQDEQSIKDLTLSIEANFTQTFTLGVHSHDGTNH
jgi:hypothetical protein